MKVIGVNVGEKPRIIEIDGSLNTLQEYVEGWIEVFYPFEDKEVACICNEEGKIIGLEPNRYLISNGKIIDIICGNFLIVGLGEDDFESLTDEQIEKYLDITMTDTITI